MMICRFNNECSTPNGKVNCGAILQRDRTRQRRRNSQGLVVPLLGMAYHSRHERPWRLASAMALDVRGRPLRGCGFSTAALCARPRRAKRTIIASHIVGYIWRPARSGYPLQSNVGRDRWHWVGAESTSAERRSLTQHCLAVEIPAWTSHSNRFRVSADRLTGRIVLSEEDGGVRRESVFIG
jgi:hypothetical protein